MPKVSSRSLELLRRYRPWRTVDEIPLTISAVLFFLFCAFLVSAVNALLDDLNPFAKDPNSRVLAHDPLLILLNALFTKMKLHNKFPDQLVGFVFPIALSRIALGRDQTCLLLRRIAWMMSLAYLIRIPFTLMTMLPNPNPNCVSKPDSNFLLYVIDLVAQRKESCGDVVFSGHTIPFMACSLIWTFNPVPYFTRTANTLCSVILSLFSLFAVLSLIAARYHYTLDCVLSAGTMLILWKLYHFSLSQPPSDHWLYSLVHYIDGDSRFPPKDILPTSDK